MTLPAAIALALALAATAARAAVLEVGPEAPLKAPSEAARLARPGDTVRIRPGEYFDCAVWSADRLTIEGAGPGVVITDKTCQGKALFVVTGRDVTVRNLTFARARVPDENGAGIRAEGAGLTVEGCRFVNNEAGILAADSPAGAIRIADSEFAANGKCTTRCAHALQVGRVALLRIERSRFSGTRQAHQVSSDALRTEIVDSEIADGPGGTSSYLVEVSGNGSLVMEGNRLQKGPGTANAKAAVFAGAGRDVQPGAEIRLSRNRFANDSGTRTAFLLNWSGTDARLEKNELLGPVEAETSGGRWLEVARRNAAEAKDAAKDLLRRATRHLVHKN